MHARSPDHDPLASGRGAVLPFLPTLLTALAIGGFSLFCRQPGAPETQLQANPAVTIAAPVGADGFHPARELAAVAIPATVAFGQLHPLLPDPRIFAEADETRAAPAGRPIRMAGATRKPCPGGRCGEARRAEPTRSASTRPYAESPTSLPPQRGDESEDGLLPPGALPFAPTAAAWVETARRTGAEAGSALAGSVGERAASLGGAVVDLIACER